MASSSKVRRQERPQTQAPPAEAMSTAPPRIVGNEDVIALIGKIIKTLIDAETDYATLKDDKSLREAFHAAGQGLTLVREALDAAKTTLQENKPSNPAAATKLLETCDQRATISRKVFHRVAGAPTTSRHTEYKAIVKQEGGEHKVEVLVVGMMKNTCDLAEDSAFRRIMKSHIGKLRDAVAKISTMDPSVPTGSSNYNFYNSGSGTQNNATDGDQNINTGAGKLITGGSFHATTINF